MVRYYPVWGGRELRPPQYFSAAVAELADALDSKSSGSPRAGSSPASGILISRKAGRKQIDLRLSSREFLFDVFFCCIERIKHCLYDIDSHLLFLFCPAIH